MRKYLQKIGLHEIDAWIDDTDGKYIKVEELGNIFAVGRSSFLIKSSEYLNPSTEIKMEIVNSEGDTIFWEPAENAKSSGFHWVSVVVYDDCPIGEATLTIMGQLNPKYFDIPEEWKDLYNVKFEKKIQINTEIPNTQPIRFVTDPALTFSETVKSQLVNANASQSVSSGNSVVYKLGNMVEAVAPEQFLSSMVGGIYESSEISSSIEDVITSQNLILETQYTASKKTDSISHNITYIPYPNHETTGNTFSYGDLDIQNLTTFSGDISKIKVYMESVGRFGKPEQVAVMAVEPQELLFDDSDDIFDLNHQHEPYIVKTGYFTTTNIVNNYWTSSDMVNGAGGYRRTTSLSDMIDAMSIESTGIVQYTSSVNFYGDDEYTFGMRLSTEDSNAKIKVYLSGSSFNSKPKEASLGKFITEYVADENGYYFGDVSENFIPDQDGSGTILFQVVSGNWFLSQISITETMAQGFPPDSYQNIRFDIPTKHRNDTANIIVKYYDNNNNESLYTSTLKNVFLAGGNTYIRGTDNILTGSIEIKDSDNITVGKIRVENNGYTGIKSVVIGNTSDLSNVSSEVVAMIYTPQHTGSMLATTSDLIFSAVKGSSQYDLASARSTNDGRQLNVGVHGRTMGSGSDTDMAHVGVYGEVGKGRLEDTRQWAGLFRGNVGFSQNLIIHNASLDAGTNPSSLNFVTQSYETLESASIYLYDENDNLNVLIKSSGQITASSFSGDGSGLTGIAADSDWYDGGTYLTSSVRIEVDGPVTAGGNISSSGDFYSGTTNITGSGGHHGSQTRIKILPSDFKSEGRVAFTYGRVNYFWDTAVGDASSGARVTNKINTDALYCSVIIPQGYKATHGRLYGSAGNHQWYECDINTNTATDIGTGLTAVGTEKTFSTQVTSDITNYITVAFEPGAADDDCYGGYVTIEKV